MSKPRIAVPVPTSFDHEYNRVCWSQYAVAIESAGGDPVRIELTEFPSDLAKLASSCSAILLPGSPADINPQKYGHAPDPATNPPDLQRENVDELLLQDAHNLHKPILGICFGLQSLNVWRGGTLIQDLTVLPVNHAAGPSVAIAHTVAVDPNSTLSRLNFADEAGDRIAINSSHHQAIGIVGDGLRVVGRCPQDGVIEAVEGTDTSNHFVLGVQWHPERITEMSAVSRALFHRFVEESAAWTPRRIETSVAR